MNTKNNTYLAHLIYQKDYSQRMHLLQEHCKKVAEYASQTLTPCHLSAVGKLAGLLHDVGKGRSGFQIYLTRSAAYEAFQKGYIGKPDFPIPQRGTEIHTFQGCKYLLELYHGKGDPLSDITSEIIACAIGSHHGLFDCQTLDGKSGFLHRIEYAPEKLQFEETKRFFEMQISSPAETNDLFKSARAEIQAFMLRLGQKVSDENCANYELSMVIRLITSALMYADRRDTAEFYDGASYPDIEPDWANDIKLFEEKYHQFDQLQSPIALVRKDISDQCRRFSKESSGIYRLNVPTGGGKTLSSLRYALYHADHYKKRKVIFVIPLLAIIDQNAGVLKEYLPGQLPTT